MKEQKREIYFDVNQSNGWGITIKETGEAFISQFEDGKRSGNGYGCCTIEDYEVKPLDIPRLRKIPAYTISAFYEGEQNSSSNRHGYGVLTTKDGQTYVGDWVNALMHG